MRPERPAPATGRVKLGDGWELWPLAVVRSAGLPASAAERLAGSESQAAAFIEELLGDSWFREALTWQNADVMRAWVSAHHARLRDGVNELDRRRRRYDLLARYAQRYATKNDTIGFFGPIGWARVEPDRPATVAVEGDGRIVSRRTSFEAWVIEGLAARWEHDRRLLAELPPRMDPSAVLDGLVVSRPRQRDARLDDDQAAVLRLCDGVRRPADIHRELERTRPDLAVASAGEVLSILSGLRRQRLITWGFAIKLDDRMAEQLRDQVAAVADHEVRTAYLDRIDALLAARAEVDAAAGDPERLLAALARLDAVIEAHGVGVEPGGSRPRAAGSRSALWLDCVSDWDMRLGAPFLDDVRKPLSLLLDCARWLTFQTAHRIEHEAARLVADGPVPFGVVLAQLSPDLTGRPGGVLDQVVHELQAKVRAILPPLAGHARVALSTSSVRAPWRTAFAAPGPGWEAARQHSPDVMLAVPPGDPRARYWVLGEIHIAVNTIDNRVFAVNEPCPGEVARLMAQSTFTTRHVPAFPRTWPGIGPRTYPPLATDVPGTFVHWAYERHAATAPDLPTRPTARLVVRAGEHGVVVTDGDGVRVPFADFVGELLSFLVGNAFSLFAPDGHVPRVSIDRLVVQRETWWIPVAELPIGTAGPRGATALAERLRERGVPDRFFAQLPGDSKPVYCDLRAGALVRDLHRRLINGPQRTVLRVQEVLPAFTDLWLGAPQRAVTSEFRFVAVDTAGISASAAS